MPHRANWQAAKAAFEAGFGRRLHDLVDKQDLGPLLDDLDSAQASYDAARGTDPAQVARRRTRLDQAKQDARAALTQYQQTIQFLQANLGTAPGPQRTAQLAALNAFLTAIMHMHLALR